MTTKTENPAMLDWQWREILWHLDQIQAHGSDSSCPCLQADSGEYCLPKHTLDLNGLARETIPMTSNSKAKELLEKLAEESIDYHIKLKDRIVCGKVHKDEDDVVEWARVFRKKIEPIYYACKIKVKEQITADDVARSFTSTLEVTREEFIRDNRALVRKVKGRWGTTHYELKTRVGDYQKVGQITSDSVEGVLGKYYDLLKSKVAIPEVPATPEEPITAEDKRGGNMITAEDIKKLTTKIDATEKLPMAQSHFMCNWVKDAFNTVRSISLPPLPTRGISPDYDKVINKADKKLSEARAAITDVLDYCVEQHKLKYGEVEVEEEGKMEDKIELEDLIYNWYDIFNNKEQAKEVAAKLRQKGYYAKILYTTKHNMRGWVVVYTPKYGHKVEDSEEGKTGHYTEMESKRKYAKGYLPKSIDVWTTTIEKHYVAKETCQAETFRVLKDGKILVYMCCAKGDTMKAGRCHPNPTVHKTIVPLSKKYEDELDWYKRVHPEVKITYHKQEGVEAREPLTQSEPVVGGEHHVDIPLTSCPATQPVSPKLEKALEKSEEIN